MASAIPDSGEINEADDFRSLWEMQTEDIRFFKLQQYSITNYALALYVAVFAIPPTFPYGRLLLTVISVVVAWGALYQLHSLQNALAKARRFARLGRNNLSKALNVAIGHVSLEKEPLPGHPHPGDPLKLLYAVVVSSCLLTVVFLWSRP